MAGKVFLSYRRDGGAETARLIRDELCRSGYSVFLDVEDLSASFFDEKLLQEIENADHFVVILTPGALSRCREPEDWLRREIGHALRTGRDVIPVLKDGFSFPPQDNLPEDIRDLSRMNGVEYSHRYFRATIEELVYFLAEPAGGRLQKAITGTRRRETGRSTLRRPRISLGRLPVPGTSGPVSRPRPRRRVTGCILAGWCTTVVQIVGDGGVGKTCLVWHWLERLRRGGYAGVAQALDWSFYANEPSDYATDGYDFLERAANHFEPYAQTLDEQERKNPDIVGEAIGAAFHQVGGLLVLDGVESLQHPSDVKSGALNDIGVGSLLRQLRTGQPRQPSDSRRLAILTTRWPVPDLQGESVLTIRLLPLTQDHGAKPICAPSCAPHDSERRLFVPSLADDELAVTAEFRKAAREYGGHPLALVLLASYLLWRYDGDLLMRREVPAVSDIPSDDIHRHARRLIHTYDQLFSSNSADALHRACRQVLWLIGLFPRPVPASLIKSLRSGAPIAGLTEGLPEELFIMAVHRLQQLGLISPGSTTDTVLETHPLIRDFFRQSLEEALPASGREAHARIFDHLCASAANPVATPQDAEPLFEAVVHGCKAGRYRDALLSVYCVKLQRGEILFASTYLGAFGQLLSVLSYFLDPTQPMYVVEAEHEEQNIGITGMHM